MSTFPAFFDAMVFSFGKQKEYYLRRLNKMVLTIKERDTFEAYLVNLTSRKFTTSQEALEKMRDAKYFDEAQFYLFAIMEKNPEIQEEAEKEFNKQLALHVPSYRPKAVKGKWCMWQYHMHYYVHYFFSTTDIHLIVEIGNSMLNSIEDDMRIPENIRKYWQARIKNEYHTKWAESPDYPTELYFV